MAIDDKVKKQAGKIQNTYKLFYEKTALDGSKDNYEFLLSAENDKEAVKYSRESLFAIEIKSGCYSWITDAYLFNPNERKVSIPEFPQKSKLLN